MTQQDQKHFHANAGIAIGPILFVIALLGILAAAIAAGSGAFTTSTTTESAKLKATALLDIAENVHTAYKLILGRGLTPVLDTDAANPNSLASITIMPPSATMGAAGEGWHLRNYDGAGCGTPATDLSMFIHVDQDVCAEINNKLRGTSTIPDWRIDDNDNKGYLDQLGEHTVCFVENDGFWFEIALDRR